jgi:hypothetical protein
VKHSVCVDVDDYREVAGEHEYGPLRTFADLEELKRAVPNLKLTLFVIPSLCYLESLRRMRAQCSDWVDLVPHGMLHRSNTECCAWNERDSRLYLDWLESRFKGVFTRGFKAPGWQTSACLYAALAERGYWIADQAYNARKWPVGLRAYVLDSPLKLHFHFGHLNGYNSNEIVERRDTLLAVKDEEFAFVKDVV